MGTIMKKVEGKLKGKEGKQIKESLYIGHEVRS